MLLVKPIPAFKDNYIWLLINPINRYCAVVDPGDAGPIFKLLQDENLTLSAVLITHHHHDHSGGILALKETFSIPVCGPSHENIPGVDHKLTEGQVVALDALGISFTILDIPGHTKGHIAYYGDGMLFCGDTLFAAGCGRLFEGTAAQMFESLSKMTHLPDETLIYCAHEYTAANLRFAHTVEPQNSNVMKRIEEVALLRKQGLPSLPSQLLLEKLTNPFLRCQTDSVINSVNHNSNENTTDPVSIFQALRAWKDIFQ